MPALTARTALAMPCGKPPDAHNITIVRGKVPSEVTLCDNCLTVSFPQHTWSDTQLIASDEGVSTHAQDRYVEV
jgi:hypothetical protein